MGKIFTAAVMQAGSLISSCKKALGFACVTQMVMVAIYIGNEIAASEMSGISLRLPLYGVMNCPCASMLTLIDFLSGLCYVHCSLAGYYYCLHRPG